MEKPILTRAVSVSEISPHVDGCTGTHGAIECVLDDEEIAARRDRGQEVVVPGQRASFVDGLVKAWRESGVLAHDLLRRLDALALVFFESECATTLRRQIRTPVGWLARYPSPARHTEFSFDGSWMLYSRGKLIRINSSMFSIFVPEC